MKKRTTTPKFRRGTIRKIIESPDTLAIFEIPVIYAPEVPDEPLLEPKTVRFLTEARKRTKAGDTLWLKKNGAQVYVGSPAA